MTKQKQSQFIAKLMASFEKRLQARVKDIPEEWDGVELRQWIADAFKANTCPELLKGRRGKAYRNEVLVTQLF